MKNFDNNKLRNFPVPRSPKVKTEGEETRVPDLLRMRHTSAKELPKKANHIVNLFQRWSNKLSNMHKTARTASTTTFSFSFSSAEVCITIDLFSIEIVKVILFSSLTFRRNLILIALRPLSLLESSRQMPCNSEGSKYAQARKFKGWQVKSRVQKLFFLKWRWRKYLFSCLGTNEDQLRTTLVHCFFLWQLFINKDSNFHSSTRSQCCKFAVSHSIISFERGDNSKRESTHFEKQMSMQIPCFQILIMNN